MNISRTARSHRSRTGPKLTLLSLAAGLSLAACGSASSSSSPATSGASTASAAAVPASSGVNPAPAPTQSYQLHMDFFSHESKLAAVIDPQMFIAAPAAPAATGPQMISHAAGISPAPKNSPAATPLLGATGSPLGVTVGGWEKAAGTVRFSCTAGQEQAASHLTGLIPDGVYSTFVVHLNVQGPGRFTPWGNTQGSNNNFTANTTGTATPTNTVPGCLNSHDAAVIIWHSDGHPHGSSPGTLGVSWHNSLITPLP